MDEPKSQFDGNFIALLPKFKFTQKPTFVIACDAIGVNWLRDRFLALVNTDTPFVIGDGVVISSDHRCKLTVAPARKSSQIRELDQSSFTWGIGQEAATEVADKLFALATSDHPGHQYVDLFRGHFSTVVIAKDEYSKDTVRAMRDQ